MYSHSRIILNSIAIIINNQIMDILQLEYVINVIQLDFSGIRYYFLTSLLYFLIFFFSLKFFFKKKMYYICLIRY